MYGSYADNGGQASPGGPDVEFFDAAAEVSLQVLRTQHPDALTNALWALARLQVCAASGSNSHLYYLLTIFPNRADGDSWGNPEEDHHHTPAV